MVATLDELTSTIMAVMVLFAVMNVTIFLILGRLALRIHISDDHGFCSPPLDWSAFLGQQQREMSCEHDMDHYQSALSVCVLAPWEASLSLSLAAVWGVARLRPIGKEALEVIQGFFEHLPRQGRDKERRHRGDDGEGEIGSGVGETTSECRIVSAMAAIKGCRR